MSCLAFPPRHDPRLARPSERPECDICAANLGFGLSRETINYQHRVAEYKSFSLFMTYLNAEQKKTVREEGHFSIIGSAGGHYRIDTYYRTYNIFRFDPGTGEVLEEMCLSLEDYYIPNWDMFFAQATAFLFDEAGSLKTANKRMHLTWATINGIAAHFRTWKQRHTYPGFLN